MEFKRKIYDKLLEWKRSSAGRSALMVDGARRVGKSFIVEAFAQREYRSYLLIDFNRPRPGAVEAITEESNDLDFMFAKLSALYDVKLHRRESLVVFDEVQLCPRARALIKYLVADGRYDYVETGSLISLKANVEGIVIPSEEEHLEMFPMDFEEFLWATGNPVMMDAIRSVLTSGKEFGQALHRQMMTVFRQYLVVGGMPQAVAEFVRSHDLELVDGAKREVLRIYRQDIHKFGGRLRHRIESIWDEIPAQLSKHEKRFKPGDIEPGVKMRDLKESFHWLQEARTLNIAYNVTDPNVGLKMTMDGFALKGYLADTGLLISHAFDENELASAEIHRRLLFDKIELNEGMLMENIVCQMIVASGRKPYFYSRIDPNNAEERMEIDFLLSKTKTGRRKNIVPIEVKSAKRYTQISLDKFCDKFRPYIDLPSVLYVNDRRAKDGVAYLPLYATQAFLESV